MSNTTWCPLCRIKVEILDITNNKFCYGCQENTDVYVLKCGNTHGMCNECTSNYDLAIVDRPRDRENEYRQAVINEENRIQEELLREEAINTKIAEIKIELRKRRDEKIKNYINYQQKSYEYIKKENNELIRSYDSVINVIIKDRNEYNKKDETDINKLKILEEQMYKKTNHVYTEASKLIAKDRANHGRFITSVFERNICDAASEAEQAILKLIIFKNKSYNDYCNGTTIEEIYSKKEKYYEDIKIDKTEWCIFRLICAKNAMNNDYLKRFVDNSIKVAKSIDEKLIKEYEIIVNNTYIHLKEEQQKNIDEALREQQRVNHEQAAIIAARMNIIYYNII